MNRKTNITRGGLTQKMAGYQPEPPQSVWEGVASGIRGKRSNRKLFIFLGAAAGLALAITVGLTLLFDPVQPGMATLDEPASDQPPEAVMEESMADPAGPAEETTAPVQHHPGMESPLLANEAGNGSRLEQKVITAMQEVMENPQDGGEKIAALTGSDQPPANTGESGQTGNNPSGSDQKIAGERKDEIREGQDQVGENRVGENQLLEAESDQGREVVNEDSLIRLLDADASEIAEQEVSEQLQHQDRKWQIGATFSPLISYREAASVDAAQNAAVNNSESARLTYAGGLGVSYLPNDRITIQTGVYYNKMGVNIGDYSSFKGGWFGSETDMVSAPERSENVVAISNSMGTVVSDDAERFVNSYAGTGTLTDYHLLTPEEMVVANTSVESFSQTFDYLEIPFNVRYKILDRTIDLQLMGGFSTNLLVNNSISALAGDERVAIGKVEDIRMVNYSGNAGIGIVYELFDHFSLSIEPRFRYYLNSINTGNLPVTRPYTFGFYTGMSYKF